MPSKSELMHYRLQAIMREHTYPDLEYLGVRKDSIGIPQHWYRTVSYTHLTLPTTLTV